MKKIMFSDRYGLTDDVLQGRKTMTRRICKEYATGQPILARDVESFLFYPDENIVEFLMKDGTTKVSVPPYKNNEVVAVAQNYRDVYEELKRTHGSSSRVTREFFHKYVQAGRMPVSNKMFVRADLMPHQIRITDIKVERLQDISEEDCLKEGIKNYFIGYGFDGWLNNKGELKHTPDIRTAFAYLINEISGKGTWKRNPWVFAYSFELVK